jgi:hypothetical protein
MCQEYSKFPDTKNNGKRKKSQAESEVIDCQGMVNYLAIAFSGFIKN